MGRHVNDYAAIILIDPRYQTEGVRRKIAGWIRKRLNVTTPTEFGPCHQQLAAFFAGKKLQQSALEAQRRCAALSIAST